MEVKCPFYQDTPSLDNPPLYHIIQVMTQMAVLEARVAHYVRWTTTNLSWWEIGWSPAMWNLIENYALQFLGYTESPPRLTNTQERYREFEQAMPVLQKH